MLVTAILGGPIVLAGVFGGWIAWLLPGETPIEVHVGETA